MMNFHDVVSDLERMIGIPLHSIKPGAEISLLTIDSDSMRLEIQTLDGRIRSRPLVELERIWNAMEPMKPVHVDKVLGGSGSSRNQPETILANLPYVEWLRLNGKKHIVNVGHETHPLGTLKRMDQVQAEQLIQTLENIEASTRPSVLVVSDKFQSASRFLSQLLHLTPAPIEQGAYEFVNESNRIVLVSHALVTGIVPTGTYGILPLLAQAPVGAQTFEVGDNTYFYFASPLLEVVFIKS